MGLCAWTWDRERRHLRNGVGSLHRTVRPYIGACRSAPLTPLHAHPVQLRCHSAVITLLHAHLRSSWAGPESLAVANQQLTAVRCRVLPDCRQQAPPCTHPFHAHLRQRVAGPECGRGALLEQLHAEVAHPLRPVLLGHALAALPRATQHRRVGGQLGGRAWRGQGERIRREAGGPRAGEQGVRGQSSPRTLTTQRECCRLTALHSRPAHDYALLERPAPSPASGGGGASPPPPSASHPT